jgi:CBS domain containing-hemolysin-like protein
MPEEHELAERAFRLDETTAWDVMTPRVSIFAWNDTLRLSQIIEQLPEVPYSRVPVFGESIDDVTGVLYVREAYAAHAGGQTDVRLSELSREPFFVPGSLPLTRLLRDFQGRRIHMGIVADEFGGTDGLVTLEDILEELVGEIVDETDPASEPIVRVSRTEAIVEGSTELREINYAMNVSLPHLEHRSLNGFLVERLGHVPSAGEKVAVAGVDIEIEEASETQILRARLRKTPAPAGGAD